MSNQAHTRKIQGYGWLPDLPDHRDLLYAPPPETQKQLPPAASVRDALPPVFDQGQLGSCTGNAIAAADEFEAAKQNAFDGKWSCSSCAWTDFELVEAEGDTAEQRNPVNAG